MYRVCIYRGTSVTSCEEHWDACNVLQESIDLGKAATLEQTFSVTRMLGIVSVLY